MNQSSRQSLWMIAASFLFAGMGVCVKLASVRHGAAEIVFWRSAVSLVLVFGIMRWQGVSPRTPVLRLQIFRGLSGFVSLALFFLAIVLLPLATAVTLNYTSPLFLAIFLVAVGGVRMRRSLLAALALGLLGVAVVLKPTFASEQLAGGLAGLASGCLAGLAYFNVRALGAHGEPEVRTVFYFALIATLGGGIWMIFSEFAPVSALDALLLVGVGGCATLAQLAMTRAYKAGKAIVSASLAYTAVIFACLFEMLVWDKSPGASVWIGVSLIVASGIAATALSRGSGAGKVSGARI
jgi:drug/metabolite transporter (DMT)-like permease